MLDNKEINQSEGLVHQVDIEESVNMPLKNVWNFLFSKRGLEIWLGTWKLDKWETGITFITDNGIKGEVRVFNLYSHIRVSWQPKNWKNISILELRTITRDGKTTLHFHQEQLADRIQKEDMKRHWTMVMDDLVSALKVI
jgi:uncharacterized protein YndB with AHSA1/START domain